MTDKTYSDAAQIAALDVVIRCMKFNERPRPSERELLADQFEYIKTRIKRAGDAREEREERK